MIGIIDCGLGNLRSVQKALEHVTPQVRILSAPEEVATVRGLVAPGVGAFGHAMTNLRERGLATAIRDYLDTGKPFLGICLGLQVLFGDSEETPGETGLGLIPGRVVRFPDGAPRIPHMGWNEIRVVRPTPLTEGLGDSFMAYFMHSYYGLPEDDSWVAGRTEHGITFASLLARDHVFAAQFHPEKSGAVGRQVLRNFVGLVEGH